MFRSTVWHPLARSRSCETAFCRDNKPLGIRMERLCDQQLACFRAVSVCRVDQVHTQFDGALENFDRIVAVGRPTPNTFPGYPHRAKAEPIDGKIAAQLPGRIRGRVHGCRRGGSKDCVRSSRQKRRAACQSRAKKCSSGNGWILFRVHRFISHDAQELRSRKSPSTQARSSTEKSCSRRLCRLRSRNIECLDATRFLPLKINSHRDGPGDLFPAAPLPKFTAALIIVGHHDNDALETSAAQTLHALVEQTLTDSPSLISRI